MRKKLFSRNKGFSLIEIVVVIAILVVLLAVLAPALLRYTENSRVQKDESAMDEVCNAVHLAMADSTTFDEVFSYAMPNNYVTYTDSSGAYGQIIQDEEYWAPDGAGLGVTITFNPDANGNYDISQGIVNNMTEGNGCVPDERVLDANKQCTLADMGNSNLYNALKQSIGLKLSEKSATYKNSSYTIFIKFNLVDGQYKPDIYGSFNGTNLLPDSPASLGSGTSDYTPEGEAKPSNPTGGTTPPQYSNSDLGGSGGGGGYTPPNPSNPSNPEPENPENPDEPTEPSEPETPAPETPTEPPHEHQYTSKTTTEATCLENGVMTYTCACGDSYTEVIRATGHTIVQDAAIAATCETDGKTAGSHCSACGWVEKAQQTISALGHALGTAQTILESTCEGEGQTKTACTRENCTHYEIGSIPAKGHVSVPMEAVAATCTKPGTSGGTKCSVCGKILFASETIPALGHREEVVPAIEPTCITSGVSEVVYCIDCEEILSGPTTVPALGHDLIIQEGAVATCTEAGKTQGEYCTRCDYLKTQVITDPVGHKYDAQVVSAATCLAEGLESYTCTVCGDFYEEITPMCNHNYTTSTTEATCTKNGKITQTCTICRDVIEDVIEALGHHYIITIRHAGCKEQGALVYTCSRCGDSYEELIDPIGHIDKNPEDNYCDTCGTPMKNIDGLGDVGVSNKDADFDYNPDDGTIDGEPQPPEPELPEEIPEEKRPEIIDFGYGKFESSSKYNPGSYMDVPFEYNYTFWKYPVAYMNGYTSEWLVTYNATTGEIIRVQPGNVSIDDVEKTVCNWLVFDYNTEKYLTMEGVKGDTVEYWYPAYEEDATLENTLYLAAYLNKVDGTNTRRIAEWDGEKYVEVDYSDEIAKINTFTATITIKGTERVEVQAPSTSTEYIYIPTGSMKAEEGMTWGEWLLSDYNTTGFETPIIKTSDYEPVSYSDVIQAGKDYGFVFYRLNGIWTWNDEIEFTPATKPQTIYDEDIIFTSSNGEQFKGIRLYSPEGIMTALEYYMYDAPYGDAVGVMEYYRDEQKQWWYEEYRVMDFGTEYQPVSAEFYEWFTANAHQGEEDNRYVLSGEYRINRIPTTPMKDTTISQNLVGYVAGAKFTNMNVQYSSLLTDYCIDFTSATSEPLEGFLEWESFFEGAQSISFPTEQTVSKEFYNWFVANTTKVSSTTLKGQWKFNDVVNIANRYPYDTYIEFTAGDDSFTHLMMEDWGIYDNGYPYIFAFYGGKGDFIAAKWENSSKFSWLRPECQIVNFGDSEQYVSTEFYNWFIVNAKPYENTTTPEPPTGTTEPESPLVPISGVWTINSSPARLTDMEEINQTVNFTSNNTKYTIFNIKNVLAEGIMEIVTLYYKTSSASTNVYAQGYMNWSNSTYKTVDFGTTEQMVTQEFYDWMVANATKAPSYELSGTWEFNNSINFPSKNITQNINFTLTDIATNCKSMYAGSGWNLVCHYVEPTQSGSTATTINYDGSWYISNKTVDFGLTPQTVSQEFYEWFTANAKLVDTTPKQLSGVWEWNSNLITTASIPYEKINFTYNNTAYKGMTVDYQSTTLPSGTVNVSASLFFGTKDTFTLATSFNAAEYSKAGGTQWNNKSTIDFGTTPQTVSQEFYDWFVANATQTPSCELSGTWKFNETLINWTPQLSQTINFQTQFNGETVQCDEIALTGNSLVYRKDGTVSMPPPYQAPMEGTTWTWTVETGRVVHFGDEVQAVSKQFYDWFTANAVPYEDPADETITFTVDGTAYKAEPGMTWREWINSSYCPGGFNLLTDGSGVSAKLFYLISYPDSYRVWPDEKIEEIDYTHIQINYTYSHTISGKWTLKTNLSKPSSDYVYQEIAYTTNNGNEFTKMELINSSNLFTVEYYNGTNKTTAYKSNATAWTSQQYRVVDFGTSAQNCSKVFYDWIVENQTTEPVGEDLVPISGKWKFNQNITLPTKTIEQSVAYSYGSNYVGYVGDGFHITTSGISFGSIENKFPPYSTALGWDMSLYWYVDFIEEQYVTQTFYDWFTSNATPQSTSSHTHNYSSQVTKQPTCAIEGEKTFTCTICGNVYIESIAAKNHNYKSTTQDATCTATGKVTYTCTVCGNSYDVVLPIVNHKDADNDTKCDGCGLKLTEYAANTLVLKPDGKAYLYGTNGTVKKTYTGWNTATYTSIVYTPWYGMEDKITALVIEEGVAPVSTAWLFQNFSQIKEVVIPDSITVIGEGMFYGCDNLQKVTIGKNVQAIEDRAFYYCDHLTEIRYNATNAANNASKTPFYMGGREGSGIDVIIGKDVQQIPAHLFSYGYGYMQYGSGPKQYFNPNIKTLTFESGSVCKSIGDYAFGYNENLQSIILPEGLEDIGAYAFEKCTAVSEIYIPSTAKSIGKCAFTDARYCKKITFNAINMNDLIYMNGAFEESGHAVGGTDLIIGAEVTRLPAYVFCPWNNGTVTHADIKSITFMGNKVKEIGTKAFYCNTKVTNLTIPDSVEIIGSGAFTGFDGLTSISIPASVKSLGSGAFSSCDNIKSVYYNANLENLTSNQTSPFASIGSNTTGVSIYIAANVRKIPDYMFSSTNSNVSTIKFASGSQCTYVGIQAFSGNKNLTAITIPDTVTYIGEYAFRGCSSLTIFTVPASVKQIGTGAFGGCTSLQTLNFANRTGWYVTRFSFTGNKTNVTLSSDGAENVNTVLNKYSSYYYWTRN